MRKTILLTVVAAAALGACEEEGPFERAGEEIDEATEDVRTEGETAANQVDDAVDNVRDDVEDAADEVDEEL